MDDEDFLAIIAVLERELRVSGLAELADERHYLRPDPDTGEARWVDPQKRLIEMLRAFGRVLAVRDRGTYDRALARLQERVVGPGPKLAVVIPADPDARPVELSNAPDLGDLRGELQALIAQLLDTPRSPDRELR